MAPLSGGPARTPPAKWRRFLETRLERYLQNGAVIRMAGFTHLCKNRRKKFFLYNIYGFPINRIYNKNSTICISRLFGGDQGHREIIFRMWKQKPLPVIAGKKQCAMPSIAAFFVAGKRSFLRCFAWSHRHKFSYLRNFDRSWSSRRCFLLWLRAVWVIFGSHHQPRSRRRSVNCDRVNVNKPKLQTCESVAPLAMLHFLFHLMTIIVKPDIRLSRPPCRRSRWNMLVQQFRQDRVISVNKSSWIGRRVQRI